MRRLLISAIFLAAVSVDGATYFVTPNGSGARTGTSWSNAGNGIDWINPRIRGGDTVFFGSGRYHGQLQIPRHTDSRDRTCYACSSFVSNYPCTLSAAAYVPGNTLSWQQVGSELFKAPYSLPFPSMENDFSSDLLYCAGEDTTLLRACTDQACITTAPRGSFYLNPSQDTFFVRTVRGDHPSLHTYWMGGRSLVNIEWNDSTRQYFTLYGFDIRYHQFGAISLHASSDSIFIDRCRITRIASSEQNNAGAVACNNVMSAADAGGRDQTYRWDGKYNRVKNCVINTIYEPYGGSDTRCCVVTTYSQSHFVVESCLVAGIGGLIHPKNRSIGGYSYGNVARYNVCRNMTGAAYHTMNYQRADSCYGNIFINSIGAVYLGDAMEPSGPGHYFGNNTIYGLRNQEIFRPHPGGAPPTQNLPPNWAKYNIFYDDNASSGYIMAFYGAQDDTSWVIDSNLYYNCESTFYGGSATNFAGWQSRLSGISVAGGNQRRHDLNSTFNTKNPGFASAATGDFSRPGQTTNEMQVTYGGRTWTRFGAVQPGSGVVNAPRPLSWIAVDSLRSDFSAEADSLRVRFLTSDQAWPDSVIIAVSTSGFPTAYQGSNRWALPYTGAGVQGSRVITMAVLESDTLTAAGWIFDRDSGLSVPVLIDKALLGTSSVTVLSPNGGETWSAGSTQTITWTSSGILPNVALAYSTNGGTNWTTITASTANDGSHVWTAPSVSSSNVLIRVADTDGNPADISNGPFTISTLDALVSVTLDSVRSDFSGEQDSIRVRWQTTAQTLGDSVVYALTTNGTMPTFSAASSRWAVRYIAGTTGSAILLPTVFETDTLLVGAWVRDGATYSAGRFDTLILRAASTGGLTVLSPNGGETWLAGSSQVITWSPIGTPANVRIEYSTNNGANWTVITSATVNDGSHAWTTPGVSSINVLVRVADTDGSPSDVSNGPFTVAPLDLPLSVAADSIRCDFFGEQDSIRIRWQTSTQTLADSVIFALTTDGSLPSFSATMNRGAVRYVPGSYGSAFLLPTVYEADTLIVGVWTKDGSTYSVGRFAGIILFRPVPTVVCPPCSGLTGNVDGSPDGITDQSDLEALVTFFFTPGASPSWICYKQANVDGSPDGVVDGSDLDRFVEYLFGINSGVTLAPCR